MMSSWIFHILKIYSYWVNPTGCSYHLEMLIWEINKQLERKKKHLKMKQKNLVTKLTSGGNVKGPTKKIRSAANPVFFDNLYFCLNWNWLASVKGFNLARAWIKGTPHPPSCQVSLTRSLHHTRCIAKSSKSYKKDIVCLPRVWIKAPIHPQGIVTKERNPPVNKISRNILVWQLIGTEKTPIQPTTFSCWEMVLRSRCEFRVIFFLCSSL